MGEDNRPRWSSRTIFLFAAIGSAVGLGNVWRFPYLTYKYGGGAFLIPYLIALFLIGIPLLILEFGLGQKLQQGAIGAFKSINKRFRGIGFIAVSAAFIVVTYYAVVMAWSLIYFFKSFASTLPWAADSKAYFFNDILHISDSVSQVGGINLWIFLALFAVWIIIYFCLWKGTKSVGKVVAWTVPLPIILLAILLIRGLTLEGAMTGLYFYLRPDFSALFDTELWLAAISQIFFTLSVGFGMMIAYASFNSKKEDVTKNAYITALTNSGISLFAGFVVFSIIGYMATVTGSSIADVAASGPGLAFVVFPQALSLMPWAWFFAALFFLTLLTLGIDSAFAIVEAVNTVIYDRAKKIGTKKIAFYTCSIAFLIGILFTTNAGLYFLDIVDHFVTNFSIIIAGILGCIAVGWVYRADKMRSYINEVSDWKLGKWWEYAIKFIIPIALTIFLVAQFITEVTSNYEGYPSWAIAIGWAIVAIPLLIAVMLALKVPKE